MNNYTILLVEDNPHIMEINDEALTMEDYTVRKARTGRECMEVLEKYDVDLIVLDIMLPDADGIALCRQIKVRYDIPILFLTALGENERIIEGLHAGGDDYLSKPYDIGVLLARIEARLRAASQSRRVVSFAGLHLNMTSMTAYYGDEEIILTQKEYALLLLMIHNRNRLIPKEEVYRTVWSGPSGGDYNPLYTTVSRLNKKLDGALVPVRTFYRRNEGYGLENI